MKSHPSRTDHNYRTFGLESLLGVLLIGAVQVGAESSAVSNPDEVDFAAMSFDDLAAIKVTSVSKKSERLTEASAAVSVITASDIHRSGSLTLAEALRLAPGVNVGRVDAAEWAVSVRGFNDTFSQKLLVLMDGRSIYTPLFSGTFWQVQDAVFADLDRIEVIRGPGGTIWGANAINGVINIVSKPAKDTQGFLFDSGGGSVLMAMTSLRYGGRLGEHTFFRVYGKYDDWNDSRLSRGGDADDAWRKGQGGFRIDWEPVASDRLTLQGDLLGAVENFQYTDITFPVFGNPAPSTGYNAVRNTHLHQTGGNVLGRWTHEFSEESELSLQTYFDRTRFQLPVLKDGRSTFDLDLRHRMQLGNRNELVWGGGYRLFDSELADSEEIRISRKTRADQIFNAFVQNEVTLVPDRLQWTFGTKVEHNDYTGVEVQPSTRLSWTPNETHTIWASVSRAVRTPSQMETDSRLNLRVLPPDPPSIPIPIVVSAVGNPAFEAETLLAYELGYRVQPARRLTLDTAAFINDYDHLRGSSDRINLSSAPNYALLESVVDNGVYGLTYGGEVAATLQAADWWRLNAQLSVVQSELRQPPSGVTGASRTPSIANPEYQVSLRSSLDLGKAITLDAMVRYVDRIAEAGVAIPGLPREGYSIPSYVTLDVRVSWQPRKDLELSVVGQNLAGVHREFAPTYFSTQFTEIHPSVFGRLTWRF